MQYQHLSVSFSVLILLVGDLVWKAVLSFTNIAFQNR